LVTAALLEPAPEETYYWDYSKHPALSYFDHPPMTAHLILIFSGIFGDSAFGLHSTAVFVSLLLAAVMFCLLRQILDARTAFWSVAVGSAVLLFAIGGVVITPDAPMLLFWFLTMMALYHATRTGLTYWWLLAGVFFGAAMYSKYTAILGGIGALLYLLSSNQRRKSFLTYKPYLSVVVSVAVFSPVIIWNYRHHWASFGFQSGRRFADLAKFRPDYLLGFLGAQIGLLAIFLAPLSVWGIIRLLRKLSDDRLALFFWFTVPALVPFVLISPFHYVKMNWLAPAYLSALPGIIHLYLRSGNRFVRSYGRFAFGCAAVVTLAIHILALVPGMSIGKADTIHGWQTLAKRVDQLKSEFQEYDSLFICGYYYTTASELRFHLAGQPEVFSSSLVGQDGLAYDYWSDPDDLVGKHCIFVYDTRHGYAGDLGRFFRRVEGPETLTVVRGNKKITDFRIYKCYNYKGL